MCIVYFAFTVDLMFVPRGLVIIVVVLVASFFLSLVGFIRRQKEEAAYQKIPNNEAGAGGVVGNGATAVAVAQSYQNSAVTADYALPMEKKVVAYYVIDGRLVDQSE